MSRIASRAVSGIRHTVFAISLLAASLVASAATLYVDQNHADADDGNPGSEELPFKTISAAAAKVEAGDTVIIEDGIYREKVGIEKTGTKDEPIVFEARHKGAVVITGADPLKGWRREEDARPVYSVRWPHNFIINTNRDGSKVRNHGADAPIGCAEQVIWDARPLTQVMRRSDLAQGRFYVDWNADRLYAWLPGGVDPNTTEVLGSTRPDQFVRGGYWGHWFPAEHIHIKGIVFRYAANFAQRGGIKAYHGWHIEDCVVEWNNAGGIGVEGNDVVVLRTITQDNGFSGIGGAKIKNVLVKDCISRRNNSKGFPVGWDGGGGKWLHSDGLRIVNHTAYENTGPGIWLDWDNRNYTIENCVCYANIGNRHGWEGMGIFIEASDGPGRIVNCTVYSNTGAGIGIAESQHLTVEYNTLVDDGESIQFRAMEGRASHKLENVTIERNRFKDWRGSAIGTSLGKWDSASAETKKLTIDNNTYDFDEGKTIAKWAGDKLKSLDDMRGKLAVESSGSARSVKFTRELVPTKTRHAQRSVDIDEAIKGASEGDVVVVPANGRTTLASSGSRWSCQIYDLSNRYVNLTVPGRLRSALEKKVAAYPMTEPVFVKVRLSSISASRIEAEMLDIGDHLTTGATEKLKAKGLKELKTSWTNAYPAAASATDRSWKAVDLARLANRRVTGKDAWIGIPVENLPSGKTKIHGVPFEFIDPGRNSGRAGVALRSKKMQSSSGRPIPKTVEVPIDSRAKAIYVLHCAGYASAHGKGATYEFVYTDGSTSKVDVVSYGSADPSRAKRLEATSNIQDWWPSFPQFDNANARHAVIMPDDPASDYRRFMYSLQWKNPHRWQRVKCIRMSADPQKDFSVIVLAVTVLK